MSTGRSFNNLRNLDVDDREDQQEYLEYLHERMDESFVDRSSFIEGMRVRADAEQYPSPDLVYEMVDVMALHDLALEQDQDEFADHLSEQVDRFFWDIERDYRKTFRQLEPDSEDADAYIEAIVDNTYDIDDETHAATTDIMQGERVSEDAIAHAGTDHAIQDIEEPDELCEALEQYGKEIRELTESGEYRPRQSYVQTDGPRAFQEGDLLEPLQGASMAPQQEDAAVYNMLKHRLFMRVAPLHADKDGDDRYLT